jgi:RNA polymerase sigma-70 factor (ECF subfamily)
MSDRATELMTRWLGGDNADFDALIREIDPIIMRYCRHIVTDRDKGAVDDLAQQTRLRLFRLSQSYRNDGSLRRWLYRMIENLYIDYRKSRKIRTESLSLVGDVPDSLAEWAIESIAARICARDTVDAALAAMPLILSAALRDYYLRDQSYEEIARASRLPLGTVKSRLSRAKADFRQRVTL